MKTSELVRKLKKEGCLFHSHGKNHDWWYSPVTKQKFQVPRHAGQDIGIVLKKYIEKQSGVKL